MNPFQGPCGLCFLDLPEGEHALVHHDGNGFGRWLCFAMGGLSVRKTGRYGTVRWETVLLYPGTHGGLALNRALRRQDWLEEEGEF